MVLKLWLDNVPSNTISFVRLALVTSMIHILSNSMVTAMLATGNIKKYQIIVGGLGMLVLPLAWFSFYIGFPAEMAYITTIIIFLIQLICRLYLLNEMIGMDIKRFIKEVLFKVIFTSSIACLFPVIIYNYMEEGLLRFFIVILISIIFFMFIEVESGILKLLIRLALIPVIAGVSYEVIRLAGRCDNWLVNAISAPGLLMQRITTLEPDDDMIEVGIASVEAVFDWKKWQEENL